MHRKIAPLIHSIVTLPGMLHELALVPLHRRNQNVDWDALLARYDHLQPSHSHAKASENSIAPRMQIEPEIVQRVRAAHVKYLAQYSASLISISVRQGICLYWLAKRFSPQSILDLGSGFSSFVLRLACEASDARVISVDTEELWLEKTKEFLRGENVDDSNVLSKSDFDAQQALLGTADFCFLDIGDFDLRLEIVPAILDSVVNQNNGILVIDDWHVPAYRKRVKAVCAEEQVSIYSLRKYTRTRLSHFALAARQQTVVPA